jgi:hypothetical protein
MVFISRSGSATFFGSRSVGGGRKEKSEKVALIFTYKKHRGDYTEDGSRKEMEDFCLHIRGGHGDVLQTCA